MATLKAADIMADLADDSVEVAPPKPHRMGRAKPQPEESIAERKAKAAAAGQGKPSPYSADLRAKLRQKAQLNFGGIPLFVRDEFERLAKANHMGLREYFYYLLREKGADIPPYKDMDGRKL